MLAGQNNSLLIPWIIFICIVYLNNFNQSPINKQKFKIQQGVNKCVHTIMQLYNTIIIMDRECVAPHSPYKNIFINIM